MSFKGKATWASGSYGEAVDWGAFLLGSVVARVLSGHIALFTMHLFQVPREEQMRQKLEGKKSGPLNPPILGCAI